MNEIQTLIMNLLPPRRKNTKHMQFSICCPMCIHNGTTADTRFRGGVKFSPNGGIVYHCFNCGYKTRYAPGTPLSKKFKKFLGVLGVSNDELEQISLLAIQVQESEVVHTIPSFSEVKYKTYKLPIDAKPIFECAITPDFTKAVDYLVNRGLSETEIKEFYFSQGYKNRVILPLKYNGIIVGWIGRLITEGIKLAKYHNEIPNNALFGYDNLTKPWRKYCIVTEGPFDALAVRGVALLSNDVNEVRISYINEANKQIIYVPDRDPSGIHMINKAIDNDWYVSLPDWDCKDISEAREKYGRLETIKMIMDGIIKSESKIKMKVKAWLKK